MEPFPGVFVTNAATEEGWRSDPEVPGSLMHEQLGDGGTLEVEAGDLFSLPPGHETTWHITTPFKEMWVLASD